MNTLQGKIIYSITLRPNRFQFKHQSLFIVGLLFFGSVVIATFITYLGGWLVLPFFGAEIFLLAFCLWWNQRAGKASETINITDRQILIQKIDDRGNVLNIVFPTSWLQINLNNQYPHDNRIEVRTHGQSAYIGDFLTADERNALAVSLRQVLARTGKNQAVSQGGVG